MSGGPAIEPDRMCWRESAVGVVHIQFHGHRARAHIALAKLGPQMGFGPMPVMTDVSAERYWTVVSEMEVESLEKYAEMSRKTMEVKEFQETMKGYHELIVEGRREICQIETK